MRKCILICSLFALLVVVIGSHSDDSETESTANQTTPYYITHSKTLAAGVGSYTITNNLAFPWRLGSVIIDMPAGITNRTTMAFTRSIDVIQYKGNEVVTNDFGFIETNVYHTVTNTATTTWTNTLMTGAILTNNTTEIYQAGDDFADYVFFLEPSELTVTVSYTNAASHIIINGLR